MAKFQKKNLIMASSKLRLLFIFSFLGSICVTLVSLYIGADTAAAYDVSLKFQLEQLNSKLSLLESNIEKIISELETKEESIKKLENIIQEKFGSLQDNGQAVHAAENRNEGASVFAVEKAGDVINGMLGKGFTLSKDALKRAKEHRISLSEKMSMGSTIAAEKLKEMDKRFQVSEKTKSAIASAGETIGSAGSVIKKNHYVSTGASWVTGALYQVVAKSEEYLCQKIKEDVYEEKKEANGQVHGSGSYTNEAI